MKTFMLCEIAWYVNRIAVLDILNSLIQSLHTLLGVGSMHKIFFLSQTSYCLIGVIPKSK